MKEIFNRTTRNFSTTKYEVFREGFDKTMILNTEKDALYEVNRLNTDLGSKEPKWTYHEIKVPGSSARKNPDYERGYRLGYDFYNVVSGESDKQSLSSYINEMKLKGSSAAGARDGYSDAKKCKPKKY